MAWSAACRVGSSPAPTRTWSCGAVQESRANDSCDSHWNAHPAAAAPPLGAPGRDWWWYSRPGLHPACGLG